MGASIWEGSQVIESTANADNTYLTEYFTASVDGTNVFNLTTFIYQPGTGSLDVYINGGHQRLTLDFEETTSSSVTVFDLMIDDVVTIKGLIGGEAANSAAESATQAAASAAASAASATASANSATASQNSAVASAASAVTSSGFATNSQNSATASATSATNSANSATASANSATAAATSATQAQNTAASIGNGAFSAPWTFSTTTADSDPGAGFLRLNNATQTSSTVIRVDLLSQNGADWTNSFDTVDDSTSAIKGQLKLSKVDDPTRYILFNVTALASPSGYRNITGSVVGSSNGPNPFANNDIISLTFTRNGDAGGATRTRQVRATNTVLGVGDSGSTIVATASFTQTLAAVATLGNGWYVDYFNESTGNITFDPNGSELIDNATTGILEPGMGIRISGDNTKFDCERIGPLVKKYISAGTSATFPLGVRQGRSRQCGGGGSGGRLNSGTSTFLGGSSGAWAEKHWTNISPNTTYSFAIGAGATGQSTLGAAGSAGGVTTLTVGGVTVTTNGGAAGPASDSIYPARTTATNGDINIDSSVGVLFSTTVSKGGSTPMGWGDGGVNFPGGGSESLPTGAGSGGAAGDADSIGQNGRNGRIEWEY